MATRVWSRSSPLRQWQGGEGQVRNAPDLLACPNHQKSPRGSSRSRRLRWSVEQSLATNQWGMAGHATDPSGTLRFLGRTVDGGAEPSGRSRRGGDTRPASRQREHGDAIDEDGARSQGKSLVRRASSGGVHVACLLLAAEPAHAAITGERPTSSTWGVALARYDGPVASQSAAGMRVKEVSITHKQRNGNGQTLPTVSLSNKRDQQWPIVGRTFAEVATATCCSLLDRQDDDHTPAPVVAGA